MVKLTWLLDDVCVNETMHALMIISQALIMYTHRELWNRMMDIMKWMKIEIEYECSYAISSCILENCLVMLEINEFYENMYFENSSKIDWLVEIYCLPLLYLLFFRF